MSESQSEASERQLHVARHRQTGLYDARALSFLQNNQGWLEAVTPTVAKVLEQFEFFNARRSLWTADIQEAEVWSPYWIRQFGQYMPDCEFLPVRLSME